MTESNDAGPPQDASGSTPPPPFDPYSAPPPGAMPPPPANPYGAPPPGGYGAPPPGGYGAPPPGQYGYPPQGAYPGYGGFVHVPEGMYQDPASGVVLPNGVMLATVGRRIGAWFLSIVLVIVTLGIGFVVWGLIAWGKGRSPAFQVLGIRVWKPNDHAVASWGTMALRNIVGYIIEAVFFGIGGIVSFIMFLANKDHRSLRDMVASTIVVYDPNKVLG